MKTQVNVFQPQPDKPGYDLAVPIELQRLQEELVKDLSKWMRIFGIRNLTIIYQAGGIQPILDISFLPLTPDPPKGIMLYRNKKVRQLAEFMVDFGLLKLEIQPSAEEMTTITDSWTHLSAPVVESNKPSLRAPEAPVQDIKLNLEQDPGGSVIEPEVEEIALDNDNAEPAADKD